MEYSKILEAYIFASPKPVSLHVLQGLLPEGGDAQEIITQLMVEYEPRGIQLRAYDGHYCFVTAQDVAEHLAAHKQEPRKLTKAALETLAIIAYHQPVTRAEVEDIRGVSFGKGTLDILLEIGFVKMRGRRRTLGRPITYGTTPQFLVHFGMNSLADLPGMHELKSLGMLQERLQPGFAIPSPVEGDLLAEDEDPLEVDLPKLEAD